MRASFRQTLWILALILALTMGGSAASLAAAPQSNIHAGGRFGPSSKSEKHPKKVVLTQAVDKDFAKANGDFRFCVTYERSATNLPDKGTVSATVELVGESGSETIANVSKTTVRDRRAEVCTADGVSLAAGDVLVWTFKFSKMSKVPAGDYVDFGGKVIAPGAPTGSFRLAGAGYDGTVTYTDGPNLVFCRTDAGFADLWIRFAEKSANDGSDVPHIDIDVCNYAGGGSHGPLDTASPSCGSAKTFDLFWHDGPSVFVNPANSSKCELQLDDQGRELAGSFSCQGLSSQAGSGSLDILSGTFRCVIE